MTYYNYCLILLCVSLVAVVELSSAAREIPDYIHICERNSPDVARCVRESVEVLKPRLKNGIPELNVPSLEPMHIDHIQIFEGESGGFRASLDNIDVHGASEFQVTKLKLNVDKQTYRVGIKIPKLEMDGDYTVDARILVVPIKGNGKFSANITDIDGQGILRGEIIENNGHRQLHFTKFDFAIKVGDYDVRLNNLFGGDEILTRAAREVFQENRHEIIKTALPLVQRKTADILLEAANRICDDLDYDQVFPAK